MTGLLINSPLKLQFLRKDIVSHLLSEEKKLGLISLLAQFTARVYRLMICPDLVCRCNRSVSSLPPFVIAFQGTTEIVSSRQKYVCADLRGFHETFVNTYALWRRWKQKSAPHLFIFSFFFFFRVVTKISRQLRSPNSAVVDRTFPLMVSGL